MSNVTKEIHWNLEVESLGRDRSFSFTAVSIGRRELMVVCLHPEATSFLPGRTMAQCRLQIPAQIFDSIQFKWPSPVSFVSFNGATELFVVAEFLVRVSKVVPSADESFEPGITFEILQSKTPWFGIFVDKFMEFREPTGNLDEQGATVSQLDLLRLSEVAVKSVKQLAAVKNPIVVSEESGQGIFSEPMEAVLSRSDTGAEARAAGGNVEGGRYKRPKGKSFEKHHRHIEI